MPYNPGVTDRSGELLAAGIASAGQSLGAAIEAYGNKRDELKGYRQVALALGLPADQVDQMSLGQIKGHIMGTELKQQLEQYQQKQKQQQSQAALMQAFARRFGSGAPDVDALNAGKGPLMIPKSPAGDVLNSLGLNPDAAATPVGADALAAALSRVLAPTKQPSQIVTQDGYDILINPNTGAGRQLTPPNPARSNTPENTPLQTKVFNGKTFYWDAATSTPGWKPITEDPSAALMAAMFGGAAGGGGGPTPQPALRFRKNKDTDAIEQY